MDQRIAARVRGKLRRNARPEDEIQKQLVAELRAEGHEVHHSPNPGRLSRQAAARAKALGQEAGCADLLIWTWPPTALEVKDEGESPTATQRAWLERRRAQGWRVGWGAGLAECRAVLRGWGLLTPPDGASPPRRSTAPGP